MQQHTLRLLTRAERIAHIRAKLALQPHNSTATIPIPVSVVSSVPQSRTHHLQRTGDLKRAARPDPAAIEQAIAELNLLKIKGGSAGVSKTASIKTPWDPQAESKKKVLNKLGLRLTLDDRRPTVG